MYGPNPNGFTNDELFRIIDAEKSNKGNKGKYFYGENYCYMNHIQFVKEKYQTIRSVKCIIQKVNTAIL